MRYWTDQERKMYSALALKLAEANEHVKATPWFNPFGQIVTRLYRRRCERERGEARIAFNTRAVYRRASERVFGPS